MDFAEARTKRLENQPNQGRTAEVTQLLDEILQRFNQICCHINECINQMKCINK
jgi:hypothetical protein